MTNVGTSTAELARIGGHWASVIRTEICLFRPDRPCDYHYHDGDEYWFVFRGHFTLNYDDREYAMRPGLMLAAGMGYEHGSLHPEEQFEAVVFATKLEGERRDGHLTRERHGTPVRNRDVPARGATRVRAGGGLVPDADAAGGAVDVGRVDPVADDAAGPRHLGVRPIGAPETQVGDDEALVAVLRASFQAGIRYLDTAESYANEARLGRLLPLADARRTC